MKVLCFVLACVAVALAGPVVKRQASISTYNLPDGSELIVGNVRSTFNCGGQPYGYYADTDNDCRIFHVCVPVVDESNAIVDTYTYNFMCGNLTVFDQQNLVCGHEADALPCNQATSFYEDSNRNFGVVDLP